MNALEVAALEQAADGLDGNAQLSRDVAHRQEGADLRLGGGAVRRQRPGIIFAAGCRRPRRYEIVYPLWQVIEAGRAYRVARMITASASTDGRATAGRQEGVIFEHPKAMPASRPVSERTTSGIFGVVSRSLPATHLSA